MSTYWIDKKEDAVFFSIPAKASLLFVLWGGIFALILFVMVLFLLFGFIGLGDHSYLGWFVLFGFCFYLIYILNLIAYFFKGREMLEIHRNGMVRFYRYGLYRFNKKDFHLDKLRSVYLKSNEPSFYEDFKGHAMKDAKIEIAFWNKIGNIWGKEVGIIEFGASLTDDSANEVLAIISGELGIKY